MKNATVACVHVSNCEGLLGSEVEQHTRPQRPTSAAFLQPGAGYYGSLAVTPLLWVDLAAWMRVLRLAVDRRLAQRACVCRAAQP
jgi:hypothetical protein